ncbi:MAG: galactarate dehydratase [Alicyclobacillus sp.]|nr:galactarate dehydratase [Alicyclobacillus sp.]
MTAHPCAEETVPRYIQVHPRDNVAIIVNSGGLPAGTEFPCGLRLLSRIPQGHKVALTDIAENGPVIRYGQVIGYATRPILRGSWVEGDAVQTPAPPPLTDLPLATGIPEPLPPLQGYTFDGYPLPDGRVGTRNLLGIVSSVQCVAGVLGVAVRRIQQELLPKYPNVDDVVALTHAYGCGVAIDAPDAIIPIRTLANLAAHPNFGGEVMGVGLGCEKLHLDTVLPGNGDNRLWLQEHEGFAGMVDQILRMADERLQRLNRRQRVTCPVSGLVVGLQCGGSDAFSGVTANPAVGFAADLLVRAGATVLFSEVTEVRDALHLLTPRVADAEVGRKLIREMQWYDQYLQQGGADRSANPSPGNKQGGLVNVVEKSLGSIAKAGRTAIVDVLSPGERATRPGLVFAATPASDFVCGTLQLAAGMNVHVFTTGRGTPYGLAMAPVIKVATRTALAEHWRDLMDIDAGTVATGESTLEEVGWEIFRLILDVASGRKRTWAERWGLHNDLCLFNPAPLT